VLQREVARAMQLGGTKGAAGSAKVVLCGHSMGGLVVADAMTSIVRSTKADEPLWPRIISVLAFDTPVSIFIRPPLTFICDSSNCIYFST
jgi:hypothetical protein